MTIIREERIGNQRLILGDCLEVMPTFADGSFSMIWTDPPYGHDNADGDLLAAVNRGDVGRAALKSGKGAKPILNDSGTDMRRVVDFMLTEAARVLSPDCCCCCCCCGGGPRPTFAWLAERMDRDGLSFFHSTIWNKVNPGLGWRYKRQHEMIMVAHRSKGRLKWSEAAEPIGNIFSGFLPGQQRQHPNEKPLWLVEGFVARHTEPGDAVLDPFMGGGTTLVACQRMGRHGTGIELDPEHFETACRRVDEAARQPDLLIAPPKPQPVQEEIKF